MFLRRVSPQNYSPSKVFAHLKRLERFMPSSLIKKFHNKPKMPQLLSIWIFERVELSNITEQSDNKFLIIGTRLFRSQLNSPDGCKLLIFLPSYWLDSRWGRQHSKRMTFWFRNASLCKVNGTFFLFSVFVIAKGIFIFSDFRLGSARICCYE